MKRILLLTILTPLIISLHAQHSVMQEQSQHYAALGQHNEMYWDSLRHADGMPVVNANYIPAVASNCTLTKRVFGWNPYWVGSVYNNYQWNLLSDLCYFDYTVSPNTGNNTNASYAWSTSGAVTAAIANGVNVHICASLFSGFSTFWASPSAQQTFISNIISDLQSRGGKGVNIDFEGMGASDSGPFVSFITNLANQLHAAIPNSEVSIALYAVDWSTVFNIPALTPYVSLFIIMGYDYYWSGSTTAGPTDPLYDFQTSYNYTLSKSITYYLKQGVPNSKLLLGLPYYGREWETVSNAIPATTTGNYSATKTYNVVRANASGYYSTEHWEPISFTPYYTFQVSSNWRECFIDDNRSMERRFDVVNQRAIGGIGIWALGYDDGYSDYWNAIRDKFSTCAVVPCSDTLWDMGGPSRNYYDNENYTYTISPANASAVTLSFSQFSTEANYDSLFLYNGPSTASPLIGAYTGTNSPGTVTSTGPSLTLRFKSDGATNAAGYTAIWNCAMDNIPPTTQISTPAGWITQDFAANFTDADNANGSGIEKSFYQVSGYNGTNWRANNSRGFFNDDFDSTAFCSDWTSVTGTWLDNAAGKMEQNDTTQSNTNIYAPLTQNLSNRYLYHWQGKISGPGNNRRAGLHFFCDNPTMTNRGNNYFVWFRVDQSVLEFYKVTNNVFALMNSVPMTTAANQWYDWKVTYDRITGEIDVWQNNIFIGSWTDPSPITNGNSVSFRSGNCNWQVDNFQVFRSRYSNAATTVSVGNCASCDMQWQNPNPATAAGRIRSITKDNALNISTIVQNDKDVDWTPPVMPVVINDGTAADIDTTFNLTQLQANWNVATDPNSGVASYWFAVGLTAGDSNFVSWTNNAMNTSVTTPVSLTPGQWYYFNVRAKNNAGLTSVNVQSDGQVAETPTGVAALTNSVSLNVYPNPFSDEIFVSVNSPAALDGMLTMTDVTGKIILQQPVKLGQAANAVLPLDGSQLADGIYFLQLRSENFVKTVRVVKGN